MNIHDADKNLDVKIASGDHIWLVILCLALFVGSVFVQLYFWKSFTDPVVEVLSGLIPASIAGRKGYNFLNWWVFGCLSLIATLPWSLFLRPKVQPTTDEKATDWREVILGVTPSLVAILVIIIRALAFRYTTMRTIIDPLDLLLCIASCLALWNYHRYCRNHRGSVTNKTHFVTGA